MIKSLILAQTDDQAKLFSPLLNLQWYLDVCNQTFSTALVPNTKDVNIAFGYVNCSLSWIVDSCEMQSSTACWHRYLVHGMLIYISDFSIYLFISKSICMKTMQ